MAEHEEYAKELATAYAVEKRQRTEHVSSLVGADRERTKAYQMGNCGEARTKMQQKDASKKVCRPPTGRSSIVQTLTHHGGLWMRLGDRKSKGSMPKRKRQQLERMLLPNSRRSTLKASLTFASFSSPFLLFLQPLTTPTTRPSSSSLEERWRGRVREKSGEMGGLNGACVRGSSRASWR